MISIAELTAVLQMSWDEATSSEVPTQFPGVPLDATRLTCWYEFWVTQVDQAPQRQQGREALSLMIDVHCYSRRPEKRHVLQMADTVRTVLSHQVFAVPHSVSVSSSECLLRIHEATVRDLTRETSPEPRLPLQHLVVSLSGAAESVSG